jgi:simple sugar transport system permease protein
LGSIPILSAFFDQDILVYLSYLLAVVLSYYLYRTRPGITARAVGVNPEAAERRGIRVGRVQVLHVLIAGVLAGLAGAAFTLSTKPGWTQNHTLGWGWLALTLVIFGRNNPVWVTVGTYLFTLFSAAGIIQIFIQALPAQLTGVVPFVLMLVVLLLSSGTRRVSQA